MTRTSLVVLACLAACSKSTDTDNETAAPAKVVVTAPVKPAAPSAPWTFDPAPVQAKLQGAWVVKDHGYLGSIEAWEVKGDQVKMFDPKQEPAKQETVGTLEIEAPCEYTISVATKGGTEGTTSHFVLDGDTLHVGLGDAGLKIGDKIVACMSNGVFVQDASGCRFYTSLSGNGKWKAEAATCSLTGATFKASNTSFHFDGEMTAHGNVFATDQLWNNPSPVKVASYDEAKAKAKP